MEMKIESIVSVWDEKLPEMFINLVNVVALTRNETGLRQAVAVLAESEDFSRLFAYGFGNRHFWLKQRYVSDTDKVMGSRLMIVEF